MHAHMHAHTHAHTQDTHAHTRTHTRMHTHTHTHTHLHAPGRYGGVWWGGGNRHICEKVSVEIVIELVHVWQIDSDIFRVIDRGHDPLKWDLELSYWNSQTVSIYQHVLKGRALQNRRKTKKQKRMLILNTNERNGQLPWLQIKHHGRQELGSKRIGVCFTVHLWEVMLYTLFQLIQTFCEQQIHWACPHPCIAELCVWCVIGHHVLLVSYDTAGVAPLILFRSTLLVDRFHFLAQLFWGAPYIQKLLEVRKLW